MKSVSIIRFYRSEISYKSSNYYLNKSIITSEFEFFHYYYYCLQNKINLKIGYLIVMVEKSKFKSFTIRIFHMRIIFFFYVRPSLYINMLELKPEIHQN